MSNKTVSPRTKAGADGAGHVEISRRQVFTALAGFGAMAAAGTPVLAQESDVPAPGDILVAVKGEAVLKPSDIDPTAKVTVLAYAKDAAGNVKKGNKNKILLVKLDPEKIGSESEGRGVDGLMAYSAICTHAGCEVKSFDVKKGLLKCPCHGSEFDPANNGVVEKGPAKHRLASLAIAVEDDQIVVKEGFDAEVGAQN